MLAEKQMNIRALSLADTGDFDILRLIFSDIEKGIEALRKVGTSVRVTEVLRVEIPDIPGGLSEVLVKPLAEAVDKH